MRISTRWWFQREKLLHHCNMFLAGIGRPNYTRHDGWFLPNVAKTCFVDSMDTKKCPVFFAPASAPRLESYKLWLILCSIVNIFLLPSSQWNCYTFWVPRSFFSIFEPNFGLAYSLLDCILIGPIWLHIRPISDFSKQFGKIQLYIFLHSFL